MQKFLKIEVDGARIEECFSSNPNGKAGESAEYLKILVVPALPQGMDRLQKLVEHFKVSGLDGVLTLGSIFENLLRLSKPSLV